MDGCMALSDIIELQIFVVAKQLLDLTVGCCRLAAKQGA